MPGSVYSRKKPDHYCFKKSFVSEIFLMKTNDYMGNEIHMSLGGYGTYGTLVCQNLKIHPIGHWCIKIILY